MINQRPLWIGVSLVCLVVFPFAMYQGVLIIGEDSKGETLASALGLPRPTVFAHRGASYFAPEHTRPAFVLAGQMGADYLELDLQRTKDGVLVIVHDETLQRTTNVDRVFPERQNDRIDQFTFAELQQLDAGTWFNEAYPDRARESFAGLKILRLTDVIKIAEREASRPGLFIEIKGGTRFSGIEQQLIHVLEQFGLVQVPATKDSRRHPFPVDRRTIPPVMIQSFSLQNLIQLNALAPQVPIVLLIDEVMVAREGWNGVLKHARDLGIAVGPWGYEWSQDENWAQEYAPERYLVTWPWYIGRAHREQLLVFPWTIDETWEMWMIYVGGGDGIITNRPARALKLFGRSRDHDGEDLWKEIGY